MNKINKSENQDEYKVRPVQNFPDYLKYVAKKSKAGFGKVHQELYRLYSESFNASDKPVSHVPDELQYAPAENGTSKSKIGLRKRWSNASLFRSSTGHDKARINNEKVRTATFDDKLVNNSFVSYIPGDKEGLVSSSDSSHDYDTFSDEIDKIKQEEQTFQNTRNDDRNEIDSKTLKFTMPHSNLTEEAIYTNDRVVYVEKFANLNKIEEENEVEKDSSDEYSLPKVKVQQQTSHEIDDYVNLRSPDEPLADIINATKAKSKKESKELNTTRLLKRNTIGVTNKSAVAKQPSVNKTKGSSDDCEEDDDNDYLPPTNWTQSCYMPPSGSRLESNLHGPKTKQSNSTLVKCSTTLPNSGISIKKDRGYTTADDGVDETEENYYIPPSQYLDPDYENVPKAIKNNKFAVRNNSKAPTSGLTVENNLDISKNNVGDNTDYDRPVNWLKSVDKCTEISKPVSNFVTDTNSDKSSNSAAKSTQHTKSVKDQRKDLSIGDYSVPKSPKPIAKTENAKIAKGQKRDPADEDYSVPSFTKLSAKDYGDSGTGSDYSVPRGGIRPVNSGNNRLRNENQSIYSVPRSYSNAREYSSKGNQKILVSESIQANINAKDDNSIVEFYNYTVDEVVDCLHNCALTKLANICKEEQLDGEYFRTLKTDDLQIEPFNMNWYHITKLFKIIAGWRPKTSTLK